VSRLAALIYRTNAHPGCSARSRSDTSPLVHIKAGLSAFQSFIASMRVRPGCIAEKSSSVDITFGSSWQSLGCPNWTRGLRLCTATDRRPFALVRLQPTENIVTDPGSGPAPSNQPNDESSAGQRPPNEAPAYTQPNYPPGQFPPAQAPTNPAATYPPPVYPSPAEPPSGDPAPAYPPTSSAPADPGGFAAPPEYPGYAPQPGYEAQPGYAPQPGYETQPPYGAQPGYAPAAYEAQPGYAPPVYGAQPPYGPPGSMPPAGGAGGGKNRKGLLIGSGIAVVVIVAVVLALVLNKHSGSSSVASIHNGASANSSASVRASGSVTLPTTLPTLPSDLLPSDLDSDVPTSAAELCASSSQIVVAAAYVGLAEGGDADGAQGCVYKNSVPVATTQKLANLDLTPTGLSTTGATLTLSGSDGSTVTVKTSVESDGKYYVTSVTIS
jgi:hypothetical protein